MSQLLSDNVKRQVKEAFAQLDQPVALMLFTRNHGSCEYCEDTRNLVAGVAALSDKVRFSAFDIDAEPEKAAQYGVDAAPTLVIAGQDGDQIIDYGIRIKGIPAGYEFTSLIRDVMLVSSRDSGLSESTRAWLRGLKEPVHLQVFVTPTCPYCPRAVILAHQLALESPLVRADMVEAMEFPELADRYGVSGVPHTTINDGAGNLIGAAPEEDLVAEIQRALA
ncbi:MAG: thioredoxin family protein [Anaerolineae bacterium]|nr:thioredoxin family protein [Thermoflexales bacterium]MDW8407624.1 thioredoxin family protein [Anaerolineae bacterium]